MSFSTNQNIKSFSFLYAFLPILVLMGLLAANIYFFKDNSSYGPNQIALLTTAAFTVLLARRIGYSWKRMQKGMVKSIKSALPAILILLMIGALAGTWMISGVVPAMIYYGLQILNPTIFLLAACVISSIVSLATGSSWTTAATVGVALLGIGQVMELPDGMIAGAIISGAYFGDKMSPLSDTTNLAPAMAGTDLITHIKYMMYTTFPTMTITLVVFLIMGFGFSGESNSKSIDVMLTAIDDKFWISPVLFIVPAFVIFLIIKKVDALPALFLGTVLGGVFAVIFQPNIIKEISGISDHYVSASYKAFLQTMSDKVEIVTSHEEVNGLLATKGMAGMMNTIWLIFCAMCFGGAMEATGFLRKITATIIQGVRSTGSLIASTAATCLFFNATASDQYLAIVVPGRMFASTFKEKGLAPENLSRTLEDTGTVTSALIPWNTCGAYQAGVLGVATGEYWMYCIFNWLSPIMTVIYGYFNIKIKKLAPKI